MSLIPGFLMVLLVLVLTGPGQVCAADVDNGGETNSAENGAFQLNAIHFNKLRFLANPDFYQIYTPYLGSQVTLAKLQDICRTITRVYQDKGYMAAECILPEQTIKNGIVEMYLLEGIVGHVRLAGDVAADDKLFQAYLNRIPLDRPLETDQVNQVKRLLAASPGTRVKVYTEAADDPEKLDLVFEVRRTTFAGEIYLNNRGSKVVGPVQAGFVVTANSLFNAHENIELNALSTRETDELRYLELNSVWPAGLAGSSILFGASYAESRPGDLLGVLDINARISSARLGWSRPLISTDTNAVSFASSLEYFKSDSTSGGARFEYNELYKIKLAVGAKTNLANAYTETNVALVHGLPGLNTTITAASDFASTGQEKFDALKFDVYYSVSLLHDMIFTFLTQGQYGSNTMPVSEYIAFGGEVMGSAYDPAEFFGNHGLGGKARLAYRLADSWLSSGYTQVYIQDDIVKVWYEAANVISSGASLAAGIILRSGSLYMELQAAKPETRPVLLEADNDLRYFGSVRYFF